MKNEKKPASEGGREKAVNVRVCMEGPQVRETRILVLDETQAQRLERLLDELSDES